MDDHTIGSVISFSVQFALVFVFSGWGSLLVVRIFRDWLGRKAKVAPHTVDEKWTTTEEVSGVGERDVCWARIAGHKKRIESDLLFGALTVNQLYRVYLAKHSGILIAIEEAGRWGELGLSARPDPRLDS